MIFKTVNNNVNKNSYDIEIKNIDLAAYHWGNEKKIAAYLDEVETFYYCKDTFDKNIVGHALKLIKSNHRVEDIFFYSTPMHLILLAITDVRKFKDVELFSREMSIFLKREKFKFSIIEVLKEEYALIKSGEKKIPEEWKLEEKLTARVNKLKDYQ